MSITSLMFALFALASVLLVGLATRMRRPWLRAATLLLCNVWFFASFAGGEPWRLAPMVGFMAVGLIGVRSQRVGFVERHPALPVGVILLAFFWLKKYTFVPDALWLGFPYVSLGLSYILFRVLQLVIDARDDRPLRAVGIVDYLNYLLNFPAFVSGPIQRFQDWAACERAPLGMDWPTVGATLERLAVGAFKVIVIGPIVFSWHQQALAALGSMDVGTSTGERGVAGAAVAGFYALFLFLNFSGYTDIVIGVARWLGMVLPENFDRPFSSASFLEFWARWHMSLSNWLKTYVYSPVVKALMQRYPRRETEPYIGVVAFFVTFFLIGFWHGQTFVFALYGFLLGLGVSGNKLYQIAMARRLGRKPYAALAKNVAYRAFGRGLTFAWFALSLVCFWASWTQIEQLCGALGAAGVTTAAATLFVVAAILFTTVALLRDAAGGGLGGVAAVVLHRYSRTVVVTTIALVTIASMVLTSGPAPDIVYKNF